MPNRQQRRSRKRHVARKRAGAVALGKLSSDLTPEQRAYKLAEIQADNRERLIYTFGLEKKR